MLIVDSDGVDFVVVIETTKISEIGGRDSTAWVGILVSTMMGISLSTIEGISLGSVAD